MKVIFLVSLFLLASCNSKSNKTAVSTIGDKVDPNVSAKQLANAFMKSASSEIDPSLKISSDDLEIWKSEGLITEAELKIISENL